MIGKILSNRYEIVEKIGGGGMALVYKAKCQLLNRHVAIKILRQEFINDKDLLDKFRKESQAAASLSHPNIVNIYDVGEEDNIYYIVMEYVEGKTLKQLIREKGKFSADETLEFARQVALALKHAHSNHIIHRDIKPHNILITEDGRAKVTDFGIALAATSSTIINTGSIIGSVHYFAPEQARGGYTDEKSDLYSLGIVMYEMITGRLPFDGDAPVAVALKHIQERPEPPSKYNPSIPRDLESIIMKLIQKEQSARYANAADLIEDLYKVKSNIGLGNIDNTLEIEDSPTQVIPALTVDEINELIDGDDDSGDDSDIENKPSKGNKKRKFLIGSAVTAALVAALLFTFVVLHLANFFKVEDVEIPKFVGLSIQEAEEKAEEIGLRLNVSSVNDDIIPKDEIIKQDIAEGMVVRKNTIVKVTVSKGSKLAIVPHLVYENVMDAIELLSKAGLESGTVDEDFSELSVGTIISQDPKGGGEVPQGTKVDYVVSKGSKPETVFMPVLVGKTLEEARDIIAQNKLEVGDTTEKHSDIYVKGYVIEQSIPENKEINVGSVVNLVVSKGSDLPEQTEEPDENGDEDEQPGQSEMSTQSIIIDLSDYSGVVDIAIEQVDGDKTKRVYNKKHDIEEEGNDVKIYLTESGRHGYKIYVNKKLLETRVIDF